MNAKFGWLVGWMVGLDLTSLKDSISVYIEPEKEDGYNRDEKNVKINPTRSYLSTVGLCPALNTVALQ